MPEDARSLLRAAAKERAKSKASIISDRFASYSSTGSLRCSACNYLTIKHESLWGAHALSKSHRANLTRIREEELRQAELQRTKEGKRKADETDADLDEGDGPQPSGLNRDADEGEAAPESKKARTGASIDPEWELFKTQMEAAEEEQPNQTTNNYSAGAALEAEAQLILQDGTEGQAAGEAEQEKSKEEMEALETARKEQEEREEILSRLEEEQRQQDEADQRVSALKQRLQRIKQARLEKQKAAKKA
ncbi:hypothetical protein NDA11_003696 [Ustilago hordei]|uniref:Coiled-coil domain-containing protein 16 n=1 Tax=Ustilago hordei TaxID=120017 RepID=I2FZL1_USTHO|nr:uncharacterized protein UHO2_03047 [Ustilago hordei]KAJ1045270.1 hypothetical protein NDA10_003551 [Ustilago hordei]KAJ1576812.1 hypothetical protein NDA15_000310 [Ustilago hordei]KAJ1578803.1 hypothetical protein NDA12_007684 [Ustilago hordei]KAJ1584070.1 hypothetical protein NDA11_003696 [Ustilago hordei]KAJ1599343.1 hypothetical protein NDA14_007264 [Ustilago hordei]